EDGQLVDGVADHAGVGNALGRAERAADIDDVVTVGLHPRLERGETLHIARLALFVAGRIPRLIARALLIHVEDGEVFSGHRHRRRAPFEATINDTTTLKSTAKC